jgi:LemA protein
MKTIMAWIGLAILFSTLQGCGYNTIQAQDEAVNAAHSQLLSVYKKRADLIPNLVEVVKGEANFEKSTLEAVVNARAKATQITLPADASPEQVKAFMAAQKEVGTGLARLLAVAENYPQLKANAGFADLRKQLGEIESQATAARNKYIRSIQAYNVTVRNWFNWVGVSMSGAKVKQQMQFEDELAIKQTPQVKF